MLRLSVFLALISSTLPAFAQTHRATRPAVPHTAAPEPTGPTAVIDTTLGRVTCRLFTQQAPRTAQNFIELATGARDWVDPATHAPQHGKPFYDGTSLIGVTDGVSGGDRAGMNKGVAGPPFATEKAPALKTDRAGVLGMRVSKEGTSSSLFVILEHADLEYAGRIAPFGLCDAASIAKVTEISHALLSAANHPATPVGIDHISIVPAGAPLPAPAPHVPAESLVPQFGPEPPAAIPSPEPTGATAVIHTTMGTLSCRLFTETPNATNNFIGLATGAKDWRHPATHANMHGKPFYNGLHFERVIPDFMIEQGDLPGDHTGDGSIGFQFTNEIVPGLTFDRPGRLAYANAGPTTNASAFFITEHAQHPLDGNYTIFGQCDPASVKIVEAIARVPRDAHNEPLKPVTVRSITIQR